MATSSGTAMITLPSDQEILITRAFDAPPSLVFRAYTTPELVRRWWPGRRGEMTVAEIDLRVGGAWRYVMIAEGGLEVGFHGEYREVVPDQRLVFTEAFEAMPDGRPSINTAMFADVEGGTTFTLRTQVESREIRDMILATGMEAGMQEGMDLLEELAVSLR